MKSTQSSYPFSGAVEITDTDLVRFLVFFAGMTGFEVPPVVLKVIKEMEVEANILLSYYLPAVHTKEEPCG